MKQYIRFGQVPSDGFSRNHRGDSILKVEKGISAWDCAFVNDVPFPLLPIDADEDCMADYFYFLLGNKPVYLVEGDELDEKGSVGEPLLANVRVIHEYTEDYEYLKRVHTYKKGE